MSRLPNLRRDDLDDNGREVWDLVTSSAGTVIFNDEGGLIGPFNAMVTAPELGRRLVDLGDHLRFGMSIERRLLEMAIVTVGARWKAEFEWWAHAAMAREHGIADAVLDSVARGETPAFERHDEEVVHAVASQLAAVGHVEASTYKSARELLGDRGMVELVWLCGYYTLVSFTLNAFDVPLPPGATPVWADAAGTAG